MKKTFYTITILMLFHIVAFSQSPSWEWAKGIGSYGGSSTADESFVNATDPFGNIYIAGLYTGHTIVFDSDTLHNSSFPLPNAFIAKYDASGNILWTQDAGGNNNSSATSVSTDAFGNVYMVGDFSSDSVKFGSITFYNAHIGPGGVSSDIFIVKYDSSGNVIWAKKAGGNDWDIPHSSTIDHNGNIYIAGQFLSDTLIFGLDTLMNVHLSGADMFVAKYDSSGTVIWAKRAGSNLSHNERANSVAVDGSKNCYVTGEFNGATITFGSTILYNADQTFCSVCFPDIFIVKYDSVGNVVWAKSGGGNDSDVPNSIATDTFGNIYIGGGYRSDTICFGIDTLIHHGVFVAKYDNNGNVLWVQGNGGYPSSPTVTCLKTDANGYVYFTGTFWDYPIIFGSVTLNNAGDMDFFIVKYDMSGNVIWAKKVGSSDNDESQYISLDLYGNIYVTGYYYSNHLNFGSTTTITNYYYYTSTPDIFIAKLGAVTGISEEDSNAPILNIQPNPFDDVIKVADLKIGGQANIVIYDLMGDKVFEKELSANKTSAELNLSFLQQGVYFLNVKSNGESWTRKIVKM